MIARILIAIVRCYQVLISPWLGPCCRFSPSCSEYCIGAIRRHGARHGSWLGVRRLLRCHPWHPGGADPVPEARPCRRGRASGCAAGQST